MQTLSVKISDEQSSALEEVIERNPGWNKALVVRAILAYFLKLEPSVQESFVRKHIVKNTARKRTEK